MHKQNPSSRSAFQKLVSKCMPSFGAFLATVLALPSSAGVVLPDEPLTTGARIPPNVLFVLDNSGSMREETMPDTIANITGINFKTQTYVRNVIYYDPSKNYLPWVDSTGATMTGGTAYNAAYDDLARVPPFATTTTNLSAEIQTYYVPKTPAVPATFSDSLNYWRYQILTNGTVERSSWDGTRASAIVPLGYPALSLAGLGNTVVWPLPTVTLPANATNMVVEATNAAGANLYIRNGSAPTTTTYTTRVNNTAATKTITVANPAAAQWYVGLSGKTLLGYAGVTVKVSYQLNTDRCTGGGWTGCVAATPTGRTAAAEQTNFATWYSYHRTRFKVAKAGAGRAFAGIGTNYRVGYRNIWNDVTNTNTVIPGGGVWPVGGRWNTHPISRAKPIPVTRNNGLFDDPNGSTGANNNRTAWYQRLYAQDGTSSTPLRKALWDSGNYFATDTTNTGPWGPELLADQYACRQNFTILTTDGYRNDDSANSPGYDYTGVGQLVGEQDSVAGSNITSPSGNSYSYTPSTPYTSNHSNTLADIAMYYWKTDLRSDLANIVQPSTANPAFWQHMTTFTISIGAAGTMNPGTDLPNIVAGTPWPQPLNLQPTSIDDLWHASVNGRGAFSIATDPDSFTTALENALSNIAERTGSFSNVASNSTSLDTGTRVFQASYLSGVWTGELYSYQVSAADGVDVDYEWRASDGIPANPASRVIMTYNGTAGATFPTAAQTTALARAAAPAVSGANNVAYIKGEDDLEIRNGGTLRNRSSRLGDIVSSSPTFSSDTGTIYIGANDGMLHAFDAEDGSELFAYVPRGIDLGNLSTLSNPSYSHRYFVDGPSVVSTRQQTPGQNILAGTLGKGGKGVFALDVTNPDAFVASNVLWERSETPGGNMGLVQGKPVIATLNDGTKALIVSNGLNSSHDRAVLLVYNLVTGALIKEIDTGAGSALAPNGLSAPVGWDADGNGTLDYVYAGDLLGNVWKFNLSSNLSGTWAVANSGDPMFTAIRDGVVQPITGGLTVALDPKTFKTWVFFGTGRLMTAGDLISDAVESMYGLIDTGAVSERTDLTQRELVAIGTRNGLPVRGFEENQPLPLDALGWYIDLLTPPTDTAEGERIVSDPQVVGAVLVTSSVIPTADACEANGKGYLNALDAFTGTSLTTPFFDLNGDGDFNDETIEDADGNPVAVGSVNLGVGMPTMANLLRGLAVVGGSSGGTGTLRTDDPRNVGRVSWREARGD